jgi:hypothetical protein
MRSFIKYESLIRPTERSKGYSAGGEESEMQRREFVKTMTALGAGLLLEGESPFVIHADEVRPDPEVKRVLVMFKCHFDAGFTDTQANVVQKYFNQYFPQAIEIARAANAAGKHRYVWTTGSWLLYEYLDQASETERKAMEEAIMRGDIAWHALPFTWWSEILNQSLIEGSLGLSQALDRRFGVVTSGAKMTDVPGHTRGLVPALAKHGVHFLDIGMNLAPPYPQVPPIFLWKDLSGASLPVAYHRDYGGNIRVPGSNLAIAICVKEDNAGPHTVDEIKAKHANLASQYPNAEVIACNLSAIAEAIHPYRDKLPVVTEEIGDTWIYGPPSDPLKLARFREVARLRDAWIASGGLKVGDATDQALLRHMLLDAEHTGGADTKQWLDYDHYKPADLKKMLDTKNYKAVAFSWAEKRQDLLDGVATLPAKLRAEAEDAIKKLNAIEPQLSSNLSKNLAGRPIETVYFILEIDPKTGAVVRLRNKATGREWASPSNPVALFTYQTLSQDDYRHYQDIYTQIKQPWVERDFGKPNIEKFEARSEEWHPSSAIVHVEETSTAHRIVVRMQIEDEEALQSGHAAFPRRIFFEIVLPKNEAVIHLVVSCFEKAATRLPESLWLTFNPIAEDQKGWVLNKTNENISPFEVVANGNRHMHGLWKGFEYRELRHSFAVDTIDAPVVAVGKERTPLVFSNDQPDLRKGIHSNLYNNAWGCNFVLWYGEDMQFRFTIRA